MRVLDFVAIVTFAAGLIALPFSLYTFRKQPMRSLLVFGIPLLMFFGACDLGRTIVQAQILADLDQLGADCQISINEKPSANPREVLSALKDLGWLPKHHSDPAKRFRVDISDHSRQVVLLVARDSRDPREYWVFSPKSFITTHNDVGRIVTSAFDGY
jgi:hypothetical protein